jgi:cytochrome c553
VTARRWWFGLGVAATIAVGLIAGLLGIMSGFYNIGASVPHFQITALILKLVLRRSVDTHSAGIVVPVLDDSGLIRLGGAHYASGCEPCHAGPGVRRDEAVAGMYPNPPVLADGLGDWEARELFWIVRHGLKYSGMPHWLGKSRGDEVWAVTAFLLQLPQLTPAAYREMTGRATLFGMPADELGGCQGCHGDADRTPVHDLAPALNGQSAPYLLRALEEYASGARESGMMRVAAAGVSDEERRRLAEAFAAMPASVDRREPADSGLVAAGKEIATQGIPRQNVPPCLGCHSETSSAQIPRLAGLSAGYIENQLRLFREGVRGNTAYGAIMRRLASRFDELQTRQVAAYFASASRATARQPEDGAGL